MTAKQPYPEEFKIESVKQITKRGHRVADVSARIGVSQRGARRRDDGAVKLDVFWASYAE